MIKHNNKYINNHKCLNNKFKRIKTYINNKIKIY